jgi:hypothetical protein
MLIIGIFHCFAHDYQCQIRFSPRMIDGMGWTDGEDVERLWCDCRHIIAANRNATAYTRRQTFTNLNMAIARSRVRNFPHASRKKIRKMLKIGREAERQLELYCKENNVSVETLMQEAVSMRAFLLQSSDSTLHIEDDICEHLLAIEDFRMFERVNELARETCGQAWMDLKLKIAWKTNGRISQGLETTRDVLEQNVIKLLANAGLTMEDWIKDGVKTQLYLDCSEKIFLTNLHRQKLEIFRVLVLRKQEWEDLHNSSAHGILSIPSFFTIRDER